MVANTADLVRIRRRNRGGEKPESVDEAWDSVNDSCFEKRLYKP